MTINYTISQCKRNIEGLTIKIDNGAYRTGIDIFADWARSKWKRRMEDLIAIAVETNREIIANWEAPALVDVIQTGYNPYMAVAALRLLCEDTYRIGRIDLQYILRFGAELQQGFNVVDDLRIIQDRLDELTEQDDYTCEDESPAESAGWTQSDHI